LDRVSLVVGKDDAGRTVAAVLKERLLFSRSLLRLIKREGKATLNGEPAWLVDRVGEGDVIEAGWGTACRSDIDPEEIPLDIIYEDESLLVVNKPPGMLVHPVRRERRGTLANAVMGHWLKKGKQNPVFRPVYRIDRDTSGMVLVSADPVAHLSLAGQLRDKSLQRIYLALAGGLFRFKEGIISQPIDRKPGSIIEREVSPLGRPALTHYRVIRRLTEINATMLEVSLKTGRTHQIRVHFSHLGHPLLGDSLYGGDAALIGRQALHAYRISFRHPTTGNYIVLKSDLPEDMKKLAPFFTGE